MNITQHPSLFWPGSRRGCTVKFHLLPFLNTLVLLQSWQRKGWDAAIYSLSSAIHCFRLQTAVVLQGSCRKNWIYKAEFQEMTLTFGSHNLKMSKYLFSFKLLSFFLFFSSPEKSVTVVQNTFVTSSKFLIAELWTSEHTGLKWKCWHNLKCSGTNSATTIILVI